MFNCAYYSLNLPLASKLLLIYVAIGDRFPAQDGAERPSAVPMGQADRVVDRCRCLYQARLIHLNKSGIDGGSAMTIPIDFHFPLIWMVQAEFFDSAYGAQHNEGWFKARGLKNINWIQDIACNNNHD